MNVHNRVQSLTLYSCGQISMFCRLSMISDNFARAKTESKRTENAVGFGPIFTCSTARAQENAHFLRVSRWGSFFLNMLFVLPHVRTTTNPKLAWFKCFGSGEKCLLCRYGVPSGTPRVQSVIAWQASCDRVLVLPGTPGSILSQNKAQRRLHNALL